jgi:hypothetical protein
MTTDSSPQDTGRRRRRATERGQGLAPARPAGQPQLPFARLELVSRDEPLEAERPEAPTAFVACRKAEAGAPTDF